MSRINEMPGVKWAIFGLVVVAGVVVVVLAIMHTFGKRDAIPGGKMMDVILTCTNPQCPGRSEATALPGEPAGTLGPHQFSKRLRADFCDWPMECPKCRKKSVYNKAAIGPGRFVTVYRMSDRSVICPNGQVVQAESFDGMAPIRCPGGGSAAGSRWDAPRRVGSP